jgi:hypothetical protein
MIRSHRRGFLMALVAVLTVIGFVAVGQAQNMMHTSKTFTGAKVTAGTVTHMKEGGKNILKLSSDFKVPDTPDPHWQIVDSKGNVYLLQRLGVKGITQGLAGDKINLQITLPAYIKDVAKVQIYCAWAEAVLGEATFESTIQTN